MAIVSNLEYFSGLNFQISKLKHYSEDPAYYSYPSIHVSKYKYPIHKNKTAAFQSISIWSLILTPAVRLCCLFAQLTKRWTTIRQRQIFCCWILEASCKHSALLETRKMQQITIRNPSNNLCKSLHRAFFKSKLILLHQLLAAINRKHIRKEY